MAGYVEKTLASGEEIVHRANFNWTFSFFPLLWFALGAAALTMIAFIQFSGDVTYQELKVGWWSAIVGAVAGAIILLTHTINLVTTEIIVTSFRFVFKKGLIARSSQEVSLNKIEEITLQQSVWGRLLGFGQLIMRGTGVGVISLPNLDNPIELRRIIENTRSNLRTDTSDGPQANSDGE